jgi:hypothetical protein
VWYSQTGLSLSLPGILGHNSCLFCSFCSTYLWICSQVSWQENLVKTITNVSYLNCFIITLKWKSFLILICIVIYYLHVFLHWSITYMVKLFVFCVPISCNCENLYSVYFLLVQRGNFLYSCFICSNLALLFVLSNSTTSVNTECPKSHSIVLGGYIFLPIIHIERTLKWRSTQNVCFSKLPHSFHSMTDV